MSFWGIIKSFVGDVFLSFPVPVNFLCPLFQLLIIISFKDSDFHNDSQHNKRKGGGGGSKIQSAKVCFSTPLTCLWQQCLQMRRRKKSSRSWSGAFLSLMISTWHPLPPHPPVFTSQLSPESAWSYYHPCPCGILLNIHHSSYEPLIIIASFCFRLK